MFNLGISKPFHRLTIFSLETLEHSYENINHRRFIDPKADSGEGVGKVENRVFFLGSVLTVVSLKHTPNCGGEKKRKMSVSRLGPFLLS